MHNPQRKGRNFAHRVKGLFQFGTPVKAKHHAPNFGITEPNSNLSPHSPTEENNFRKFELPIFKLAENEDSDIPPSAKSQALAGIPCFEKNEAGGSTLTEWNASISSIPESPPQISVASSMTESVSLTNFDNNKFRRCNDFRSPEKVNNGRLYETKTVPGLLDDRRNEGSQGAALSPCTAMMQQEPLETSTSEGLNDSKLDALDEDLMNSIVSN